MGQYCMLVNLENKLDMKLQAVFICHVSLYGGVRPYLDLTTTHAEIERERELHALASQPDLV